MIRELEFLRKMVETANISHFIDCKRFIQCYFTTNHSNKLFTIQFNTKSHHIDLINFVPLSVSQILVHALINNVFHPSLCLSSHCSYNDIAYSF